MYTIILFIQLSMQKVEPNLMKHTFSPYINETTTK